MKEIQYELKKLLAVICEKNSTKRPYAYTTKDGQREFVNCMIEASNKNFYVNNRGLCVLSSYKTPFFGTATINDFNIFNAIVDQVQTGSGNGNVLDRPDMTPQEILSLLEKKQEHLKTITNNNPFLYNSNRYIAVNLREVKVYAVVYDVVRCRVECIKYTKGKAEIVFEGNAQEFNNAAAPDIEVLKAEAVRNAAQKTIYKRLYDEKRAKLYQEKSGDLLMVKDDPVRYAAIKNEIEAASIPSNLEISDLTETQIKRDLLESTKKGAV